MDMPKPAGFYEFCGMNIPIRRYNTVVIGAGAAGLNAADSLYAQGGRDTAIITENVSLGTSRNAGSDKQTYYKLTLGGDDPDSVADMARTLSGGGCVDGDIALCEAALSAECFFKLVALGVPFPRDRYGGWAGYKTDHDPRRRATSAGPHTSRLMTEKLHEAVMCKGIPVYGGLLAIRILTNDSEAAGIMCLNLDEAQPEHGAFVIFCCKNIILATGGPAGIYQDTVYPAGQRGSNGLAFEAGAGGANLTEWQYGLASLRPRWNVSGTYMQVLPRFISIGPEGTGEREFLEEYFSNGAELLTNVFLKGYQWPFDSGKACMGSSLIDLCVFRETLEGRKVYLDYRENPLSGKIDYNALGGEARAYLEQAGACFGTPYERLLRMNAPAVEFYRGHGVDLASEPLEIALCAQHNNGGIAVDCWWRTRVEGLFAVGECAATHGVRRPGGSALNAGQAGSLRAAQYIAARRPGEALPVDKFIDVAGRQISETLNWASNAPYQKKAPDILRLISELRINMSKYAGTIRDTDGMHKALDHLYKARDEYKISLIKNNPDHDDEIPNAILPADDHDLFQLFILRELIISQTAYISAFIDYAERGGKSRGGAIYSDKSGVPPHKKLPELFSFTPDDNNLENIVQETYYNNGICGHIWRKTRPLPTEDDFFENVWRDFRAGKHIDE